MRRLFIAAAVLSFLNVPVTGQERSEKATLKVAGMSCNVCAKTVEQEAKKIDGLKTIAVSQPKGQAEITYDPSKTSPEAIAKRITEKTSFKTEAPKKR